MKVGRNDPCPCGSGKKYKKCCLEKDQAAERAQRVATRSAATTSDDWLPAPPTRPEPPPPPPPDPRVEAWNARWEDFEAQDYEGKIALFNRTLDETELMDHEMAFEMLNQIYYESVAQGERDRFDALVDRLRERLPDAYAHDIQY